MRYAEDIGAAAVPMGMLLAWCVNMHLVSTALVQEHERLTLRVRMQDAKGSELLIAAGGDLARDLFNTQGQTFLDDFYDQYMDVYQRVLGQDGYSVEESWLNYQQLAQELTRIYYSRAKSAKAAKGVFSRLRHWFRS